ncbi:MAG: hypothetical protein ACRDF0_03890 [Candidatus Limnocylindria bacterium]
MTPRAAAIWRLLAIVTAWAIGATIVWALDARGLDPLVPALFAAGAYVLTQEWDRPARGDNVKYWRGRRIDDDDDRRRWH